MLKTLLAAGVAPMLLPARVWGDNAPSKRITLGFVGLGSQGRTAYEVVTDEI